MVLTKNKHVQKNMKNDRNQAQVALFELLKKFDGVSTHECKTYKDTTMKTYRLKSLPKYLIMHIKRFKKNIFYVEKNPTIVNFPVKYDM